MIIKLANKLSERIFIHREIKTMNQLQRIEAWTSLKFTPEALLSMVLNINPKITNSNSSRSCPVQSDWKKQTTFPKKISLT